MSRSSRIRSASNIAVPCSASWLKLASQPIMIRKAVFSRRAWLGVAISAVAGAVFLRSALPSLRKKAIERLYHEDPNPRMPSPAELVVVAAFTGALVGRRLDPHHLDLLAKSLTVSATHGRRWAGEYAAVAAFADQQARKHQPAARSFLQATDEIRERIVRLTMAEPSETRLVRRALLLLPEQRTRLRIRHGTAGHLRTIYQRSLVPWQLRGYRGGPGAPVDRLEYTRPGPAKFA